MRQHPKKKISGQYKPTMTDHQPTDPTDAQEKSLDTVGMEASFWDENTTEPSQSSSADDSTHDDLEKWTPDRDLKVNNFKTREYADIRAAKYLLQIKPDHFADIYREKARKKLEENAKRLKNGAIKEPSDTQVERQIKLDHKLLKTLCVEVIKGGKHGVLRDYRFCAPKKFGRRFSKGIQNVWAGFRSCLLRSCTSDIDMKNAHPTILRWVCETNNIDCQKLSAYIAFRDNILKKMQKTTGKKREYCKEQFLISINESRFNTQSDYQFLKEFDLEIKGIQKKLRQLDEYRWLNAYIDDKEENYDGVFINLVMCYWENRILEYAIAYFNDVGVDINTLMFDGIMVSEWGWRGEEGNEVEGRYPLKKEDADKHLKMLNLIVKKCLGIDMVWDVKSQDDERVKIPDDYNPDSMLPMFDEIVDDFNKSNKKVAENYLTLYEDGTYAFRKRDVFSAYHWHRYIYKATKEDERDHFVNEWLHNYPDIIQVYYERAREYPPGGGERSICPHDHLNLWTPFDYERWQGTINPDGTVYEYNQEYADMFENMVRGLCDDNEEYFTWFMQWLYTCIFHPATKSGRVPFFISKQGVGKDTLVEILQFIFGYHRCVTESSPELNVWGQFNSILQATYFIILTEVGVKAFVEGLGKAKHLMTQYEYTLNVKNQAQVPKMSTFHRFMGITNVGAGGEITPVPVTEDERRFVLFRASERLKGNQRFWDKLYHAKDSPAHKWNFIRSCFECIKKYEHGPMFSDSEVPKTDFQKQAVTRHPIQDFMIEMSRAKDLTGELKYKAEDLWTRYREFAEENNVSLGNMTKEQFGIKLTRFKIPGIGDGKNIKFAGKVIKGRVIDFKLLKEWANRIDPMITPERQQEVNTILKKRFKMVYYLMKLKKKVSSDPGPSTPPQPVAEPEKPAFKIVMKKPQREKMDLFANKQKEKKETDEKIRNIEISDFKSAGVLLYSDEGFWMGCEEKLNKKKKKERYWCDYGGKREGLEKPFDTARRECKEECGIDIGDYTLENYPVYHPDGKSKHVVYMIRIPPNIEPEMKEGFTEKKKTKYWDSDDDSIHPRLRFDKEFLIHKKLEELNLWTPFNGCHIEQFDD